MASGAAKRYAQAVLSLAKEAGTTAAWQADLALLNDVVSDADANAYLRNPSVSDDAKIGFLVQVLAKGSGREEAKNLARLLVHRGRVDIAPELHRIFEEALLAEQGIVVADVTTAEPLDDAALAMVQQRLAVIVGKNVQVRTHVDPTIIGGIVALIDDQLIDGSVVNQLRRLRQRLGAA
jgi:F-type H+-transporting ATPase subunit delta